MIAIREAHRAGLLGGSAILPNVIAGVIVGVVALPLAMAFAIASGVKPEQGIYTAIVAGIAVAVFGGSRVQIAGPTGAFIVILAAITAEYGVDGLQIATLMAGLILIAMGLARMGAVIKFIPDPVIAGFTAGIGVIIWVGQWTYFFGLPAAQAEHFHSKVWQLLLALPALHPVTTALSIASLAIVLVAPRLPGFSRVPGPLVALVAATSLQSYFQFEGVVTIGTAFGGIPQGLPHIGFPEVTVGRVLELIGPAFTIALLGSIESLLSAVVADGMAGTRHDSNQELIGQGVANVLCPFFGGFAATGAIARTATNIRNGGSSPLAGLVHSVTLVVVLVFLAPLAANIPLAVLAAILFIVAWNMSDVKHFVHLVRRAPHADVVILLVTFFLTVFTDLVVAVNIGVVLAMLQFLRRMASSVEVVTHDADSLAATLGQDSRSLPAGVLVYAIEGPFFFAAAERLQHVLSSMHGDPRVVVLRLDRVPFMDATGLQTLDEVIQDFARRGVKVLLSEANERVRGKLQRAGIVNRLGSDRLHDGLASALEHAAALAADSTEPA